MTRCWLINEDKAGMAVQCRALATALGVEAVQQTVVPRRPWKWLPTRWWRHTSVPFRFGAEVLAPPWPQLVISCGRHADVVAAAIRRASAGATYAIHLQSPRLPRADFDLIIAPRHDGLAGPNVITMLGSLHGLEPRLLAAEAARMKAQVAPLPRPYVTVLIGGTNRHFRFGEAEAVALAEALRTACRLSGGSLLVTPSRRTSPAVLAALAKGLAGVPHTLWNRCGDNPYLAYLGLADHLVVTGDSVNMTTEACATGKPVHVVRLPGHSARFAQFHAALEAAGMTRPFSGRLPVWDYPPLLEMPRVAAEVEARLGARARVPVRAGTREARVQTGAQVNSSPERSSG